MIPTQCLYKTIKICCLALVSEEYLRYGGEKQRQNINQRLNTEQHRQSLRQLKEYHILTSIRDAIVIFHAINIGNPIFKNTSRKKGIAISAEKKYIPGIMKKKIHFFASG